MHFKESRFTTFINKSKGMYAKAFHHTVTFRNCSIGHSPHNSMSRFLIICNKVPKGIVSTRGLRNFRIWLRFHCMNKIREFNCILNKENRNIICNYIIIAFLSIKLYCKTSYISNCICRASKSSYCRESYKYRSFYRRIL